MSTTLLEQARKLSVDEQLGVWAAEGKSLTANES
jgi:hypothetical protein